MFWLDLLVIVETVKWNYMSKKTEEIGSKRLKNLIKSSSISNRRNCSKYWVGVTKKHYITMCELVYKFAKNGWEVFTEVEFKKKGRADLIAISGSVGQIVEILHTESEEKFNKKKLIYPSEFILRSVHTGTFDIDSFDI